MTLQVDIAVEFQAWEELGDVEPLVARIVAAAVKHTSANLHKQAEISLMLCDDPTIRKLNRDWRKIDKATNVLSFPVSGSLEKQRMLGDIAIAFETTRAEAVLEQKSLKDHFAHLVTHGFLHLLGYDHESVVEAETMETAERAILAALDISDPYAGTLPAEARIRS